MLLCVGRVAGGREYPRVAGPDDRPSGKGKSSSYDTILRQMPKESQIGGTLSDRALFYHDIPETGDPRPRRQGDE